MARTTESLSFAVTADEKRRIEQLADRYTEGERSRLLRLMLDQMDAYARAEQLEQLQSYGVRAAARAALSKADVHEVVRHRLAAGPSPRARLLITGQRARARRGSGAVRQSP